MYQKLQLAAGVGVDFHDVGDFMRVLDANVADLTIIFYRNGAELVKASNLGAGYAERFAVPFDKVRVTSDAGGPIAFVTRLGNDVRYDAPPTGNVEITNTAGAFAQSQKTITNASAQVLAAKATRRYLLIQNNAPSGDVFVTLDGSAATVAHGIKIGAGGALELANFCPTGAIFAIGSIPSNAAVVVVEG